MSSNSKLFVKPFIGGLNTELSSVEDAILNTSDELNCTILPEGIRGRRLGFNIERDGVWVEGIAKDATSVYYWDNVGKRNFDYIVVQRDTILHFFINSESKTSTQKSDKVIDLSRYVINSIKTPLKFASVAGDLIVVGEWINPVKISWDFDNSVFNIETVNIKWRDLIGVDDGLKIDDMPTELTPEHRYNLYNQGWDKYVYDSNNTRTHALDKFKSTINLYPSNSMLHYLDKRGDTTSDYDAFELMKHFYGNTPAPKGHYILDYFSRSRATASGIITEEEKAFSQRDLIDWASNDWWRKVLQANTDILSMKTVGAGANIVKDALKSPLTNVVSLNATGGISNFSFTLRDFCTKNGDVFETTHREMHRTFEYREGVPWYTGPINVSLFGVTSEGEDVEIFSEQYVADRNSQVGTVFASDSVPLGIDVSYDKYYVKVDLLGLQPDDYVLIQPIWSLVVNTVSTDSVIPSGDFIKGRIKDVVCFSGRYFYLVDDTVLFSQVLTETGQGYDKCYQEADPTSEEISDVVDTDGGYVKFPSMGYGKALKTFNRGVLVFGDSSVYGIISPSEQIFTATSYDIVELSRAGLSGPESIVSTSDKVFYWSPLGIFQIGISDQTGRTVISQSITISTIQELYNNIPNFSKEHCKGIYDYVNNRIYWYYPTDEKHIEKLSGCLVLDLTYNSFMQFKVGEPSSSMPSIAAICNTPNAFEIKPTMYVRVNGEKVVADSSSVIAAEEKEDNFKRWTAIKHLVDTGDGRFSFGEYNSREFKDFDQHSYDSYMVSRPIMFAGFSAFGNAIQDSSNDKQVPILQTLFKRTEQAALLPKQLPSYRKNEDTMNVADNYTDTDTSFEVREGYLESGNVLVNLDDFDKPIWEISVNAWGYKDGVAVGRVGEGYWSDGNYYEGEQPKRISIDIKPISNVIVDTVQVNVNVHHGVPSFEDDGLEADVHTNTVVVINDGSVIAKDKPYVAASGANIRMRWGWSLNEHSNRWDMVQNGYRPQKDFMNDEYVESRIHIRGRGKAFQVEVRNDDNKDFRLAGMNLVVRSR